MKKYTKTRSIILMIILVIGTVSIQGQTIGDIDSLSQWRTSVNIFDGYESVTHEFKYYISGTISNNSLMYYEIYRSGYSYVNPAEPMYFDHVYSGAIREHENKWYALNYLNEDVLLYDFTMNVGDTVESMTTLGAILTVINIDTIMVDSEPKKRFFLDYGGWGTGEEYIIEDIGASTGLFEALIFFEIWSEMYCYAIDFSPLWLNPNNPYCDLSVSIQETEEDVNILSYPNPFTNSTTIEYELKEISNIQFTVYNIQGGLVYETNERSVPQGSHKVTWSPSHLPGGVYYGLLRSNEGVSVVKIIKE